MEDKFEYTYSAKEQKEIEEIRNKYIPREETKLEKLRRLDRQAETPGTMISIIIGLVGTLVMGTGMSMTMVWEESFFVAGIIVGIIGMILIGIAYPIYKKITKKQREKLAPQIIALTEEI